MRAKNFVFGLALVLLLLANYVSYAKAVPVEFRLNITKDGLDVNASIGVYTVKNYVQKDKLIASGNIVNGHFAFNYSEKFNETLKLLYLITLQGKEYRVYKSYEPDVIKSEVVVLNETTGENTTVYCVSDAISLGLTHRAFGWVAAKSMLIIFGGIIIVVVLIFAMMSGKKKFRLGAASLPGIAVTALLFSLPVKVSTSGVFFYGLTGFLLFVVLLIIVYLMGKKNVLKV